MEELVKMLKRFGPRYELNFRYDYFSQIPSLRIELRYYDETLNQIIKQDSHIPLDQIQNYSQYGPRMIEDMQMAIQNQIHAIWGEYGIIKEE
jgi:hypothetical protein